MKKIAVGLTYDLKTEYIPRPNDPPDFAAELDPPFVIDGIESALNNNGYKVVRIGNARKLLNIIKDLNVDIVFNIAEGLSGRNRESQVPIILEMMGIPFVGSDGLTLGLTLDKVLAKKIFEAEKIPTPKYFEANSLYQLNGVDLSYPLIVKPKSEGTSKGLDENSIVRDRSSLKKQVEKVLNIYKQPALVEEFIEGKEFTVALLGNEEPMAFPVVQYQIDGKLDLGNLFYTNEMVTADEVDYICPAKITDKLAKELQNISVAAYKAVGCRDFGRVDFRVDSNDRPYVLEINPLPCLNVKDAYGIVAKAIGVSFDKMINNILNQALKRYGMIQEEV